ncbi:MAG: hypothetical protein RLP44_23370 [Aggregatilineales bacterium]
MIDKINRQSAMGELPVRPYEKRAPFVGATSLVARLNVIELNIQSSIRSPVSLYAYYNRLLHKTHRIK